MGAVVKSPLLQLTQASATGLTSGLFLDESLAKIPTMNSKEIRSLSRFLPVIVLIDKSTIKKLAVREIVETKSLIETSESSRLLGLVGQAVDPFKTSDADSAVVFGDVMVSFSPAR
jgi:hypothetical protein